MLLWQLDILLNWLIATDPDMGHGAAILHVSAPVADAQWFSARWQWAYFLGAGLAALFEHVLACCSFNTSAAVFMNPRQ